jgi:flagellin-like hook-associated protein FlgL
MAKNKYNGTAVVSAGTLSEAEINPDDSSLKLSLTFVAGDIPDVSSFALGTEDSSDVQAELEKITSYTVKADGYLTQINNQKELNTNIITSKENTISSITDVDEAKALAEATSLQVRQQATVSMMAQANSSAAIISRLYQ